MACGNPTILAQDQIIVYDDETIDKMIRGIGNEGTMLYEDEPPDAIISERTKALRRAGSQTPGQYGSDAHASEVARMFDLCSKAAQKLADEKVSYTEPAPLSSTPGSPVSLSVIHCHYWKRDGPSRGLAARTGLS
eukprot:3626164-Heterocapsa_arctica.AAC.1